MVGVRLESGLCQVRIARMLGRSPSVIRGGAPCAGSPAAAGRVGVRLFALEPVSFLCVRLEGRGWSGRGGGGEIKFSGVV